MWHGAFAYVTWPIRTCDMIIRICDVILSCLGGGKRRVVSFSLLYMYVCVRGEVGRVTFLWFVMYVTWLIRICDMAHSYTWHDEFYIYTEWWYIELRIYVYTKYTYVYIWVISSTVYIYIMWTWGCWEVRGIGEPSKNIGFFCKIWVSFVGFFCMRDLYFWVGGSTQVGMSHF